MLKKLLLAGMALVTLNSTQATQTHGQTAAPSHQATQTHGQTAAPSHQATQTHEQTAAPSHCPPCPCGGVNGWVLIPAGPGTPCHQGAAAEEPQQHHEPAVKRSLHPPRTPEQEHLERELQPVKPHIYLRANPHSPDPTKKEGESGKALNGKVYFRHLGNWVHDPSVDAERDIVATGVKEKIASFNNLSRTQHPRHNPEPRQAEKSVETAPATKPETPAPAPGTIPPPPGGAHRPGTPAPRKSWPKVNTPDALGTTEGRVQSVYTNPTEGNERQFSLGAPNRAQAGVTGEAPPKIDVPASTTP